MINYATYYYFASLLVIIACQTGNCDNFQFLLIIGDVFAQNRRNEESIRYAAKNPHIINSNRGRIKLDLGPVILHLNVGKNLNSSSEVDVQEDQINLESYHMLEANVSILGNFGPVDVTELLNDTAHVTPQVACWQGDGFEETIGTSHVLKVENCRLSVISYNMSSVRQYSTSAREEEEEKEEDAEEKKERAREDKADEEPSKNTDKTDLMKEKALKLHKLDVNVIIIRDQEEISNIATADVIIEDRKPIWLKTQRQNSSVVKNRVVQAGEDESFDQLGRRKTEFNEDSVIRRFLSRYSKGILSHEKDTSDDSHTVLEERRSQDAADRPEESVIEANQDEWLRARRKKRDKYDVDLLGISLVALSGNCQSSECSLGNMVTDAMYYYQSNKDRSEPHVWSKYPVALVHGHAFTADLPREITVSAIREAMKEVGKVSFLTITGEQLEQLLLLNLMRKNWTQVSGAHVYYYRTEEYIRSYITVRCGDCEEPMYTRLDHRAYYGVIMNYQMAYSYFYGYHDSGGPLIQEMVAEYIRDNDFTYHHVDERYLEVSATELSRLMHGKCSRTCLQSALYYFVCLLPVLNVSE